MTCACPGVDGPCEGCEAKMVWDNRNLSFWRLGRAIFYESYWCRHGASPWPRDVCKPASVFCSPRFCDPLPLCGESHYVPIGFDFSQPDPAPPRKRLVCCHDKDIVHAEPPCMLWCFPNGEYAMNFVPPGPDGCQRGWIHRDVNASAVRNSPCEVHNCRNMNKYRTSINKDLFMDVIQVISGLTKGMGISANPLNVTPHSGSLSF